MARGDAPRSGHNPTDALKYNRVFVLDAKVAHVVRFDVNEIRRP